VLESPLPAERPLAEHVEALLALLEARGAALRRLCRAQGGEVSFLCDLFSDAPQRNVSLPHDLLRRVAALGADLHVSVWTG
jgi:hypothetical protein